MKKAVSFKAFFLALLSFGGIGAACGKAGKTDYPKIDTTSYNEQSIKNFAEYKALGIGAPLSAVKSGKVAAAKAYAEEESVGIARPGTRKESHRVLRPQFSFFP